MRSDLSKDSNLGNLPLSCFTKLHQRLLIGLPYTLARLAQAVDLQAIILVPQLLRTVCYQGPRISALSGIPVVVDAPSGARELGAIRKARKLSELMTCATLLRACLFKKLHYKDIQSIACLEASSVAAWQHDRHGSALKVRYRYSCI